MTCEVCGTPLLDGRLINTKSGKEVCGPRCSERADKTTMYRGGEWRWQAVQRGEEVYQ